MDCYDTALRYVKNVFNLSKPIAEHNATKETPLNDYRNYQSTIISLEIGVGVKMERL
jgi:hypothetical protein